MSHFVEITDICSRLDWATLFEVAQPMEIDLGAGDGDFILAWASRHPGRNFLAVERLLGRARKIDRRAARAGLRNLRVLRLESAYTLQHLCPPGSVSVIHLMFPDPWPKRKQRRNRLVQPGFVDAVVRALVPGGEFRFTTDHAEYFESAGEVLDAGREWQREPVWELQDYPVTDFQRQWEGEGRPIHRARWRKSVPAT